MSIQARKDREKETLRHRILDTALQLFNAQGYERTTVRKIAAALHYSPTTLYLYFKNKRDIFYHLHETVFELLFERLEPLGRIPDPVERLNRTCREYLRFAFEFPNYYHLMFIIHSPGEPMNNLTDSNYGMKCLKHFRACSAHALETGAVRGEDAETITFMTWSFLHGMASLIIQERPRMYSRGEQLALQEKALQQFIRNLTSPIGEYS